LRIRRATRILGRSDPGADAELAGNLERFSAVGMEFQYFATDVVDQDAVAATVVEVERLLGPVTAFIHAAGVNTPRLLGDLDNTAFQRTILPKLQGARNVLAPLDASQLKLFVAFGSLIARAGMAAGGLRRCE
jgi:enediyne polyketide synthase